MWKVRYAREDLAALRLDAAAGGQAQCDHLRSSDLVIRACRKCGMPGRTLQLFDGMQQRGFKLNVSPTRQRSGDQGMWKVRYARESMARLWFLRLPGSEVPKAIYHFSFWPVVRRASQRPAVLKPGRSRWFKLPSWIKRLAICIGWRLRPRSRARLNPRCSVSRSGLEHCNAVMSNQPDGASSPMWSPTAV